MRKLLSLAAVGAVLTFSALGSPAQAAPTETEQAHTIQTMVDSLLLANPGAQKTSDRTVRLANGVEATASVAAICPYLYLCIYDTPNFRGTQWNFIKCGFVNIGLSGWGNRIRSYENDQTRGTVSIFMNWNGSDWEELARSSAPGSSTIVTSVQYTDGLWVC